MHPKVSVIIPTYNRDNFLHSSIKSILDQSFEDFEIIVVDDASTDNTGHVLDKFDDKRIRYIRHRENKGGAAARNTGIKNSKGEFIGFLDDDDLWMPSKLERQLNFLKKNLGIGAVSTGAYTINKSGKVIGFRLPSLRGKIFPDILKKNYVGSCSQVLVRKECFDRTGLFDENLPACQDWDMWIRLAKHYQFDYVDELLVLYRVHGKRITTDPHAALQAAESIFEKFSIDVNTSANQREILGYWHYQFGRNHCKSGNTKKGKKEFMKAICNDPYSLIYYIRLFASSFGTAIYNAAINLLDSLLPASVKSKIAS